MSSLHGGNRGGKSLTGLGGARAATRRNMRNNICGDDVKYPLCCDEYYA